MDRTGCSVVIMPGGPRHHDLGLSMPLFAHKNSYNEFTIYSRQPIPEEFAQIFANVRTRIDAMENAQPGKVCRVFLCGNERLYSFFTLLTPRSSDSMALGLSYLGNIYINETKVRRMAAQNYGGIRHSRFEGNYAEVIAHEIAHFNVMKALGFGRATSMPVWKSEGYAEYQANIASTRADSSYVFTDRTDLLLNDAFWGYEHSPARRLFAWHVLVEFLAEVKGLDLEDLIDDDVTEWSTRQELISWFEQSQ
jgi:hypothetical protein